MVVTRKRFRLAARWNARERDIYAELTPRFANCELSWFFDNILNNKKMKQLEAMGYDLNSMRFHIDKTPEAIAEHERRAGRET